MKNSTLLDIASFLPESIQFPNAWVGHLPFAAWIIGELRPKVFVELGTHSGNSYFSFCQAVAEIGLDTKCYAVDTWKGDEHAGRYSADVFTQVNIHNQERYTAFSRLLRMKFDDALSYFSEGSIDLLHIDGLHTYDAVRHDFESWLPKLSPGAVVLFHDTNVRERGFCVWKLWEELQERYPQNIEFLQSHGLGVLQLCNGPVEKQLPWLASDAPEQQTLKGYFAALGARQLERYELTCARKTLTERDGQITNLNQAVAERNGQNTHLNQVVAERDGQITNLNQAVAERNGQNAHLNQVVAERDGQITSLNQAVAERNGQIAHLNQVVAERDGQIANFNQAIAERDGQIASLNQAVAERDGQISSLNQVVAERSKHIEQIIHSKSWFITKPLRWFGRICRGDFELALDPFIRWKIAKQSPHEIMDAKVESNEKNTAPTLVMRSPIEPTHPTAVIVPVYRGVEMTKRCIQAAMPDVLALPNAKLLAINDASPDAGMQKMLDILAEEWPDKCAVLKHETNLGFVRTVNRGLKLFPQYDVVLLNSDVVVPAGWLRRLIDEAYSRSDVGTVTPFSNNATICSFPYFLHENTQPFNLDVNAVDAVFRKNELACIAAPTGVGFCMYIRRACIDEVGYLNEEKFGRGYGEENDLCQRAIKKGWLNLVSPNLYAYHEGGVSFSEDKQSLVDRAMRVLDELHPNYHEDVQKFIQEDPVRVARVTRYVQLLGSVPIPKVLHLSHSLGGGIKQHIDELAAYYDQRAANILLTPHGGTDGVSLSMGVCPHADRLIFSMPSEYQDLVSLLKIMGVSAVHIHHTHGFDTIILKLPTDLAVARLITVHDYYWLCANPTLTDEAGRYAGYYSEQLRNSLYPLPRDVTVKQWQESLHSFIEEADCVIYPSNAAKCLFETVYRPSKGIVVPHIEQRLNMDAAIMPFKKKSFYTIGVLGALGKEKGANLLEEIAIEAKKANARFIFKLIGYAYRPLSAVEITGPYQSAELDKLIQNHKVDMIFFPAQCPETYSYTLSYALHSGLPIVAPNIGAFPERLSGRLNTILFDYPSSSSKLLGSLSTFVQQLEDGKSEMAPIICNEVSHDFYSENYLKLVKRDLKVDKVGDAKSLCETLSKVMYRLPDNNAMWREKLVNYLWRLRMTQNLKWLSDAIPHRVRRTIRVTLSNGNSDEIARAARIKQ